MDKFDLDLDIDLDEELEFIFDDEDELDYDFDFPEFANEIINQEDEEEYTDVVDRIMKLNDRLSEDIILRNIESALSNKLDPNAKYLNYITLFKRKVSKINTGSVIYNREAIESIAGNVKELVLKHFSERYSVTIGDEGEFYFSQEFLSDLESLYEFFFVRHYSNLINYFSFLLQKMKKQIVNTFSNKFLEEEITNDIFVITLKKKFRNEQDVLVIHFLDEIVNFLIETFDSGYDLFMDIAKSDEYEVVNSHIIQLLDNYGNGISILDDREAYKKYLEPLSDVSIRNEFLNELKLRYLEGCILSEEALKSVNEVGEADDQ